jgi:hypothetical protein
MQFKTWLQYFKNNHDHFDHIDWTDRRLLTPPELDLISDSIRQFQCGEYSEGKHFLQFSSAMKDHDYVTTIPLFIKEEQDHSAVLGRFMEIQSISRFKKHWLDNAFRGLRKLAGLEGIVTVLLTAEMISMVYYKALSKATGNVLLRSICRQVLKDEVMHLRFQSHSLQAMYKRKSRIGIHLSMWLRKILLAGTVTMVWVCHRRVLEAGGYHFYSFARDAWKELRKCNQMIRGERSSHPIYPRPETSLGVPSLTRLLNHQ